MRCDFAQDNLKALLDDELRGLAKWLVERHIARCAACAEEWRSLRALNAAIVSADLFSPEARLPRRRPGVVLRVAIAGVAVAAIVAAMFLMPIHSRTTFQLADPVAAAITHVNTWHFSGWKQIGGKHVSWDVWGRRTPFLYYEKVGDDITYDDGKQRLRIYQPNAALKRPIGLVIKTASQMSTGGWVAMLEPSVASMVDGWNWQMGGGMFARKPFDETLTQEKFRRQTGLPFEGINTNAIYTISKYDFLPREYELHYDQPSSGKQWDTESLTADYQPAIPDDIANPAQPADFERVDLTQPATSLLTVKPVAAAVDVQGNVMVTYRALLGSIVLTPASTFSVRIDSVNHQEGLYAGTPDAPVRYIHSTDFGLSDPSDASGTVTEFYTPLKPIRPGEALPKSIHVTLDVAPNVSTPATDIQLPNTPFQPENTIDPLFQQTMSLTVALPDRPTVKSIEQAAPASLSWVFRNETLPIQTDQARINYYRTSDDCQNQVMKSLYPDLVKKGVLNPDGSLKTTYAGGPTAQSSTITVPDQFFNPSKAVLKMLQDARVKQKTLAVPWQKQLIADEPDTHIGRDHAMSDRLALAALYGEIGDKADEHRTLRDLIARYDAQPDHGSTAGAQAEYALKTGQYPWDSNYAGPTH